MSSSPGNEATGTPGEQPDEMTSSAEAPADQAPPSATTPPGADKHDSSPGTQPQGATPAGTVDDGAAGPAAQPGAAQQSPSREQPPGAAEQGGAGAPHGTAVGDPGTERSSSAMRTSLAQRFAAAKDVRSEQVDDPTIVAPAVPPPAPASGAGLPGETTRPPAGVADAEGSPPAGTAAAPGAGRRRVRLAVARIDPWSVMKLAFLLSIAVGIGIMVAAAAMWYVLDSMHVFSDIRELLVTLDSESFLTLLEYAEFDRVISMAAIVAVIDIFLLTALATLGAFLYNIVAALVGGLHLTLTDD